MLTQLLERFGRKRTILSRVDDSLYLERYYLLFAERQSKVKWFPFNLLLHHICASDPSGFHDHPWPWASLILKGGYWEHTPEGTIWRGAGSFRLRSATAQHRLEIDRAKAGGETWTLFLVGTRIREWGFIDPQGRWVQWEEYLDGLKQKEGDR